jgi:hypothetical protein
VASFLALLWGAVIPCFRKVILAVLFWILAFASKRVCRIVLFCVSCEQNRPSNLDEMMASVKVPGRK